MESQGWVRVEGGRRVLVRRTRSADLPKPVGKPVSRDQQVVRYVVEQIGSGAIQPGNRISEKKIATELGFSTGPVREGRLSLAPLGLIRKRVTSPVDSRIGRQSHADRTAPLHLCADRVSTAQ